MPDFSFPVIVYTLQGNTSFMHLSYHRLFEFLCCHRFIRRENVRIYKKVFIIVKTHDTAKDATDWQSRKHIRQMEFRQMRLRQINFMKMQNFGNYMSILLRLSHILLGRQPSNRLTKDHCYRQIMIVLTMQ